MQKETLADDEKLLLNTVDFYLLQRNMRIELLYQVSEGLLERGYTTCPEFIQKRLPVFYAINIPPIAINTFLIEQTKPESYFFEEDERMSVFNQHIVAGLLACRTVINAQLSEADICFAPTEVSSFLRNDYRLFSIFTRKEWTAKKIRMMKEVLSKQVF